MTEKFGRFHYPCPCGATESRIGQAWTTSGQRIYPYVCIECGKVHTRYAKKSFALSEGERIGGLPEVLTATQAKPELFARMVADKEALECAVCGAGNVQYHHWAPWHLFPSEAEKWPGSYLCQSCHTRWHQVVTPNMGQARKVLA